MNNKKEKMLRSKLLVWIIVSSVLGSMIITSEETTAEKEIFAKVPNEYLGCSLATGDFNGDGYDDVLIGASKNIELSYFSGRAYFVFGSISGIDISYVLDLPAQFNGERFGSSVAAGDFNNDGYDDGLIGAPYNNEGGHETGRTYIFYGNTLSNIDSNSDGIFDNPPLDIPGPYDSPREGPFFGSAVATGDYNGDGYDDAVVGAPANNEVAWQNGAVYVFYGGISMDTSPDITFKGTSNGQVGSNIALGDFNGDNYDDILTGAHVYGGYDGRAYILYGGNNPDNLPDIIFSREVSGEGFGYRVASGDFNGDNYDDALIHAYRNWEGGVYETGRVYLFYGGSTMDSVVDLDIPAQSIGEFFGSALATGDLNKDGFDDTLIGAGLNDKYGTDIGIAYIFHGSSNMDEIVDIAIPGHIIGERLGNSVAFGDFNGDSYDDVAIGAYKFNSGDGHVYIYDAIDDLGIIPGPDLMVSSSDISFSNPNPVVDETIMIDTTVRNVGYGIKENWTTKTDMPAPRALPGIATVNDKIYIIGGYDANGIGQKNTYEYDLKSDTWAIKADMPTGRGGLGVAVVDNKIYAIAGAVTGAVHSDAVEVYDPSSDNWFIRKRAPISTQRSAIGVVHGKIYIIGGDPQSGGGTTTVYEYNPATDTWNLKNSMPTPRFGANGNVINEKIYVIEGSTGSIVVSQIEVYNPITDVWTNGYAPLPIKIGSGTSSIINNKIYYIGGEIGGTVSSTVLEYNPSLDTWSKKTDIPTGRFYLASTAANNKIYAIGGKTDANTVVSTVEEYQLETITTANVSFYDGDPDRGGILIGQDDIVVWSDAIEQVSTEWTPTTAGTHEIYVRIEDVIPGDADWSNNIASKSITVDPITATIDIDPNTLNLKSKGKWITCYNELPKGYDVADIDVSTVKISDINGDSVDIPVESHPTEIDDYDNDGIADLMVKFDRTEIKNHISPGDATITVTGEFTDSTQFEGSDIIRVIDKGKK